MHTAATDPASLPAHKLANAIAARRLSPVDVVAAFLDRIAAQDAKLHAFVEVYVDEARLAAEAADKAIRSGHSVGPLHGMPIALKDLIEIEGKIVTGGALIWRDRRAERTATLARKLIAQGMIVLGKTHTVEFAYGGWGTNARMGTPWNPWDPNAPRTPGGSSSGSGVAVAAGLAPWAIGTDTGGSVRLAVRRSHRQLEARHPRHAARSHARTGARHRRRGRACRLRGIPRRAGRPRRRDRRNRIAVRLRRRGRAQWQDHERGSLFDPGRRGGRQKPAAR